MSSYSAYKNANAQKISPDEYFAKRQAIIELNNADINRDNYIPPKYETYIKPTNDNTTKYKH